MRSHTILKSAKNHLKKEKTKNRKLNVGMFDNLISKFIIKEKSGKFRNK